METSFETFQSGKYWGISASFDLYNCNPESMRDKTKIQQFVIELCHLIQVQRFGECQIVHFGEDERIEGFSMTQLIETSLVSGHFANASNTVYLDVFSCKFFDPNVVAQFSQDFFEANSIRINSIFRK